MYNIRGMKMNFRLGFIAPYSELGNSRVVCDELSEEVDIRYGILAEVWSWLKKCSPGRWMLSSAEEVRSCY